jgi:hypothetical protein
MLCAPLESAKSVRGSSLRVLRRFRGSCCALALLLGGAGTGARRSCCFPIQMLRDGKRFARFADSMRSSEESGSQGRSAMIRVEVADVSGLRWAACRSTSFQGEGHQHECFQVMPRRRSLRTGNARLQPRLLRDERRPEGDLIAWCVFMRCICRIYISTRVATTV